MKPETRGRPDDNAVVKRRKLVLAFLAASAAASDEAVKRLSVKVGASEPSVRRDLAALKEEAEAEPEPVSVPKALLKHLDSAKSSGEILEALREVISGSLRGEVGKDQGRLALDAVRVAAKHVSPTPVAVEAETGERQELARCRATGLSDREIEKRVGLPQAFVSKGRAGGNKGPKAEGNWERLRAWLDENFPQFATPERETNSSTTMEVLEALERTTDFASLDVLSKRVSAAIISEDMPAALGKLVIEALRERRQVLERALEERRAIDARKPVTVRVVWQSDWRRKLEVNLRAEAGIST